MSKSITGSGSLNLTLNELRLLEIKATSIESINAIISNTLSGNNAVFSGTINTIGLSVSGTFTVVDFVSTGTITANNIICNGEITYKNETLDNRFVTNTNLTTILNNYVNLSSTQRITGDKTFDSLKLNLQPTTTIANFITYPLCFYPTTGSINRFDSFEYNGHTGLLKVPNLQITDDANIDNNLTVDNDIQVNNNVTVSNRLTASEISNTPIQTTNKILDMNIIFCDSADNNIYKVDTENNFSYNANSNRMKVKNIEFDQNITGSGNINITGDITGVDFQCNGAFSIGDITAIVTGGGNTFNIPILAFNSNNGQHTFRQRTNFYLTPNNNTLFVRNIDCTQDTNTGTITTDRLDVEANLYMNNLVNNTSTSFLRIPFFTASNQMRINSNNFLVQPSTGIIKQGMANSNSDVDYPITFYDSTNKTITTDGTVSDFTYNPSTNRLTASNLTLNNNLDVTNDLQVTGRTDLGTIVSINALNETVTNTTYRFLVWDNTGTPTRTIRTNGDLYFDTTDDTLHTPNIETGIVKQNLTTKTDSIGYQVVFYDTTNKLLCNDSQPSQFTYNPSTNKLSLGNIVINNETEITKKTDTSSNANLDILFVNSSDQLRVNSSLNYNPSTSTLNSTIVKSEDLYHGINPLPINYVETFFCDTSSTISSEDDSGGNIGQWGYELLQDEVFLKFQSNNATVVRSNYKPNSFGIGDANRSIWNWETTLTGSPVPNAIDTSYYSKYFYMHYSAYNGTGWEMTLNLRFRNMTYNNRVAPRIVLRRTRNSTTTVFNESEFIHYVRMTLAEFSTVQCKCIIHDVQSTDEYQILLQCARGGDNTFTSTLSSSEWEVQQIYHEFKYLGKLDKESTINPRDPTNYG